MRPTQKLSRLLLSFRVTTFVALVLFVAVGFIALGAFSPELAQAQQTDFGIAEVDSQIALSGDSIVVIILRVIRILLGFLGLVLVSLVIYAGYEIMTSAGNEEKVERGKTILKNAVIGAAIILFSFIIVQFAINVLSDASGAGGGGASGGGVPGIETFTGVGSLGRVIRDHYPRPNQTGVYRNTKIVVTFTDEIDPSSIIFNTNGSCWGSDGTATTTDCGGADARPYYGDCIDGVCDTLNTSTIRIERLLDEAGDVNGEPLEATALVAYENGSAHTFVFKPIELLGNDQSDEWHKVTITNKALKTNGEDVFYRSPESFYVWKFQTNTEVDLTPPYVIDISPRSGETIEKNRILKITFSEPVDPTVVQGMIGDAFSFTNILVDITDGSDTPTDVTGSWKITNGYQTVEFVSSEACGINSCGETIYCLPTGCEGALCEAEYTVLARTASLEDPDGNTFISAPAVFNGVRDMADNAMDSSMDASGTTIPNQSDLIIQEGPAGSDWRHRPFDTINHPVIQEAELTADNFWWSFTVQNVIDTTIPHIRQVYPGIDQEGVDSTANVDVYFSKEMWEDTLTATTLEEYPETPVGLGYRHQVRTESIGEGKLRSILTLLHPARPFGPGGIDFHYFVNVPGTVKANNQFCMYPGRGPDAEAPQSSTSEECTVTYDTSGNISSLNNCVPGMSFTSSTDTGCVITNGSEKTAADVDACLDLMRQQALIDLGR